MATATRHPTEDEYDDWLDYLKYKDDRKRLERARTMKQTDGVTDEVEREWMTEDSTCTTEDSTCTTEEDEMEQEQEQGEDEAEASDTGSITDSRGGSSCQCRDCERGTSGAGMDSVSL